MQKKGEEFVPEEFDWRKNPNLTQQDLELIQNNLNEYQFYDGFDWDYECAVLKSGSSFGE